MRNLALSIAFLFTALAASAQSAPKIPTAEELAKKNIDEIETRLKLSVTQKSIIYNYVYDLAKVQVTLIKAQQAGSFQNEDATQYFIKQNETNNKIKSLLKGDQIKTYNALIEDRLNGTKGNKKKKRKKEKDVEEEEVVGIEGLKSESKARP